MELDERELHRLKELVPYKILVPTPDEICDEIERLKEQLNDEIDDGLKQSEIMLKQHNEIERLNNIINELEEYSKELRERIDKALELIYDTERKECVDDLWGNIEELVDILKGCDKE